MNDIDGDDGLSGNIEDFNYKGKEESITGKEDEIDEVYINNIFKKVFELFIC